MRDFVLTSEAFTRGHPDKLCDQISDAVVDACLTQSPCRGATAECALASGVVFLSVRSDGPLAFDAAETARRVLREAGYRDLPAPTVMLDTAEDPDLAPPQALACARARQMTTCFGYACGQTAALMPYPVWVARGLARRIEVERDAGRVPWSSPDAQVQVAIGFADRRPIAVRGLALTVPAGHDPVDLPALEAAFREAVVDPAFEAMPVRPDGATRFVIHRVTGQGGPAAHSGLTGRKTGADSYGGFCRQSGSALSGKDPARIDRVGVYAAHHAARAVVMAGLADECEVQLSYAPGDAGPLGLEIDSFATGALADEAIAARLAETVDLRLGAIMERFALWEQPMRHGGCFYRELAAHGQLGRTDLDLPWDAAGEAASRLS